MKYEVWYKTGTVWNLFDCRNTLELPKELAKILRQQRGVKTEIRWTLN